MNRVREVAGLPAQRLKHIDQRRVGTDSDLANKRNDLARKNIGIDAVGTWRIDRWWRGNVDQRTQRAVVVDQTGVVARKIGLVRPVLGFGVIRSKHHDDDVWLESVARAEVRIVPVRLVTLLEKRAAAGPKVLHGVFGP